VSFVDLTPTVLSLAGVRPPEWMQGRAIMGPHEAPAPPSLFGLRGRMDERIDLVRSLRDHRYVYVRNFMPHRPHGQHNAYMFETPTTRVWKRLFDEGRLSPAQSYYWEPKVPEELYDLRADPEEVKNLAGSPEHQDVVRRFRAALHEHMLVTRDVDLLPEGEMHARAKGSTPYELARDSGKYPLDRILAMAELASGLDKGALPELRKAMQQDSDSAVRYWATMGVLMRGRDAIPTAADDLRKALKDDSAYVRIAAAEALGRFGSEADLRAALPVLLDLADVSRHGIYVSVFALNAIDALGPKTAAARRDIEALPRSDSSVIGKMQSYIPRLLEAISMN